MTYYTIDFSDGTQAWTHKEFGAIGKYDYIVRAQGIADYLLKTDPVLKHYVITKNEHEIVEKKDKEPSVPKIEKKPDKTVYRIQRESICIPYKWLDTVMEFSILNHAQLILDNEKKTWPDHPHRIVKREYYYEETVLED